MNWLRDTFTAASTVERSMKHSLCFRAVTRAPYIAGDRFSAADVYCGTHIGMGLKFGWMENRPSFAAYWQRVSDRDAYRRATALDDALMPKSTGT